MLFPHLDVILALAFAMLEILARFYVRYFMIRGDSAAFRLSTGVQCKVKCNLPNLSITLAHNVTAGDLISLNKGAPIDIWDFELLHQLYIFGPLEPIF